MQDELLGYLLGALDVEDLLRVESYLEAAPHARVHLEVLRRGLLPLKADDGHVEPPNGLAHRTCRTLWVHVESFELNAAEASKRLPRCEGDL